MYTRPTNAKTGLITPESTPAKRRYKDPRLSSSTSNSPSTFSNATAQRRLPRKPAPAPPSPPEPLYPEIRKHLNHPVDVMVHIILQGLYQHVFLNLAIIAQEDLRSPILAIQSVTRKLGIFCMHLVTAVRIVLCLAFCATRTLAMCAVCVLIPITYNVSACIIAMVRYFWALGWNEVIQHSWNVIRNRPGFDEEVIAPQNTVSSPGCTDNPNTVYQTPCGRRNGCPSSPRSLRKSRHTSPRSSPRPRTMNSLCVDILPSPVITRPRSSLGHRGEDLQRLLADCSEMQLEAAGKLVHGLRSRAQARAGWKP